MKDYDHMEAMLGTWTVTETIKAKNANVKVFTVAHVMKSPTRGYACELDGCSVLDGNICFASPCGCCEDTCVDMSNSTVHASDFSVFFNIGVQSYQKNSTVTMDTNGWVGPYSAVATPISENSTSFQLRYVHTADTEYLHGNRNATLYPHNIFGSTLGKHALQHTIQTQTNYSGYSTDDQIGTCDHGNVHPLLPSLEFDFWKKSPRSKFEHLTVRLMNDVFLSTNETEALGLDEADLRGPFCYQNMTNSSWMITSAFATAMKGCVDNWPCLPPAAEGIKPHVTVTNPAMNFDVTNVTLTMICFVLGLLLTISVAQNIMTCRKDESDGSSTDLSIGEVAAPPAPRQNPPPPPYEAPENPLEEPLLPPPPQTEEQPETEAV